jgi:hypothetical protein
MKLFWPSPKTPEQLLNEQNTRDVKAFLKATSKDLLAKIDITALLPKLSEEGCCAVFKKLDDSTLSSVIAPTTGKTRQLAALYLLSQPRHLHLFPRWRDKFDRVDSTTLERVISHANSVAHIATLIRFYPTADPLPPALRITLLNRLITLGWQGSKEDLTLLLQQIRPVDLLTLVDASKLWGEIHMKVDADACRSTLFVPPPAATSIKFAFLLQLVADGHVSVDRSNTAFPPDLMPLTRSPGNRTDDLRALSFAIKGAAKQSDEMILRLVSLPGFQRLHPESKAKFFECVRLKNTEAWVGEKLRELVQGRERTLLASLAKEPKRFNTVQAVLGRKERIEEFLHPALSKKGDSAWAVFKSVFMEEGLFMALRSLFA